jgi:outer membrane lipoprotein-sorting protein
MYFVKIPLIIRNIILTSLFVLALSACATVPKPVEPVKPGKEVETLQSVVSLSVKNSAHSMAGNGYLIFKRPDRFHLVVLAPFGVTVMEVFVNGEHITCLVPSKQTAYTGSFSDLPERNALKGWSMMRWVVEDPPSANMADGGERECVRKDGRKEFLLFDARGLLQRKTNEDGDQIVYGKYEEINGVAFPATIEMFDRQGNTVKVAFDEPEINQPVEDTALAPNLEGFTVLPITNFKGL